MLDEKGEPMIGVSVLVKGTKVGVITDFEGNFKLTAPSGATVLQLTYMGYKPPGRAHRGHAAHHPHATGGTAA